MGSRLGASYGAFGFECQTLGVPAQRALRVAASEFDMSQKRPDRHQRSSAPSRSRGNHKLAQLCALAERTLALTLGECANPILNALCVESVTPAPDASRLLVSVVYDDPTPTEVSEIYHALTTARGLLRRALASELNRKRTPELIFTVSLE